MPGFEQAVRERREYQLNVLASACGCAAGSVAGASALLAVAVFYVHYDVGFSPRTIVAAVGIVIAIAVLAKIMHVVSARMRLYVALGRLRDKSFLDVQPRRGGVFS